MADNIWAAMKDQRDILHIPFRKQKKPLSAGYFSEPLLDRSKTFNGFVKRYSGDSPRLYAFDRKCSQIIAKIGYTVFRSQKNGKSTPDYENQNLLGAEYCSSPGDVPTENEMLKEVMTTLPELQEFIDLKVLCRDIVYTKDVFMKSGELKPTESLNILERLQQAVQFRIKAEKGTRLEKAENFLESFTIETPEYDEIEALTYLFSRGKIPNDAANRSLIRWKKRNDFNTMPFEERLLYDNSIGRLIHNSQIGGYKSLWKERVPSDIPIALSTKLKNNYFHIFRSDIFAEHQAENLCFMMQEQEKWIINDMAQYSLEYFDRFGYFMHTDNVLDAASLIFGYFKLNCRGATQETIDKLIDHLLNNQTYGGAWGYRGCNDSGIISTAMVIHALSLAKPHGWQKYTLRAKEWLRTRQYDYGCWCDEIYSCAVSTTVLVLDAMEMADGGTMVTFKIPNEQSRISPASHNSMTQIPRKRRLIKNLDDKIADILEKHQGKDFTADEIGSLIETTGGAVRNSKIWKKYRNILAGEKRKTTPKGAIDNRTGNVETRDFRSPEDEECTDDFKVAPNEKPTQQDWDVVVLYKNMEDKNAEDGLEDLVSNEFKVSPSQAKKMIKKARALIAPTYWK